MVLGDGREPVVGEVNQDPVGLLAKASRAILAGARLGEKAREWCGETIERHLEQLDLLRRDVGRRLGAVR